MDSFEAERIATGQLEPGERLLWSGTPSPGALALAAIPSALFGIPFLGFSCFWTWTAWGGTRHIKGDMVPFMLFPLFGVPFVLVGLWVVLSPLWAYLGALKTVYAVTDKRAVIMSGAFRRNVRSFTADEIGEFVRNEDASGRGNLLFASKTTVTRNGFPNRTRIGFVGVPDVRNVEQLMRAHLVKSAA